MLEASQPEDGQDEGRRQRQRDRDLRDEQEPQPVDAVREHAAAELEEDERHALCHARGSRARADPCATSHVIHANVMYSARWPRT